MLSFAGGASAATVPASHPPPREFAPGQSALNEEEVADISLATFYIFDKETVPSRRSNRSAAGAAAVEAVEAAEGVEAAEAAEAAAVEAAEAAAAVVRSGGAALACRADALEGND